MEPSNWAPAHSDALRKYFAMGMSYAEIARAINAEFRTHYSRCAAIGRARRLGLAEARWLERAASAVLKKPSPNPDQMLGDWEALATWLARRGHRKELPKLRCAAIEPRGLSLLELGAGDCRYPYGGDAEGEPITFCGHRRRRGSSYCKAHLALTRAPDAPPECAVRAATLRLVSAA